MALECLLRPIFLLLLTFILHSTLISSLSESEALLKLKDSFTNATALGSWMPDSNPCNANARWIGIICYNGIVTGLRLENMGLSGNIDVESLVDVPGLRTISFAQNSFSGSIPGFNRLGYLKAMYLSGNQFSGPIQADFFTKMGGLKKVWLSNNKFTGEIPSSLSHLSNLLELRLENNQFTGVIPSINQPLMSFNVSNNQLGGSVPPGLARFNSSSFEGNPNLCATLECNKKVVAGPAPSIVEAGEDTESMDKGNDLKRTLAGVITLSLMLISVIVVVIIKFRRKGNFATLGKDNSNNNNMNKNNANEQAEIQVSMPTTPKSRSREQESIKEAGTSRKGSSSNGKGGGIGELVVVNGEKGAFGLQDLMKAAAEVLGNGGLGSSYKAVMANGKTVVVKRLREMNALEKDAFDAEIKKLAALQHKNILTPLAFHYRKDEKLLIYDYISKGSLLYLLHGDHGPSRSELNWPARLKIIQGIAKGLRYLYSIELGFSELPHGNLKSSNILIGPDNEALIAEYGFSPLVTPETKLQALFAYKAPEAAQFGISPKCDVYCLGIVILETLTGKFPTQYLNNGNGGIDVVQWVQSALPEGRETELLDPEISSSPKSTFQMKKLLQIGAACAESNPMQRPEMKEAIQRIEEIKLEDDGPIGRTTIQVLPSHRDGYADAPHGYGEHVRREQGSGSSSGRSRRLDNDRFSFAIS